MDGPAEVNQARAPKRPYPEEEEDKQDVCCFNITHSLVNGKTQCKYKFRILKFIIII